MSRSYRRQLVSAAELQQMFNDGGYQQRADNGEYTWVREYHKPANWRSGQPPGTFSQIWSYFAADGRFVARVHRFWHPQLGVLGNLGHEHDPKELQVGDVRYWCQRKQRR